jgi:hypothetical protein
VELAARASADEVRHAAHCADILRSRRADVPPPETRLLFFGPRDLGPEQRLTYEVVAQSCISETESMATLVTLLDAARDAHLKHVLQELARDEVQHARLGWAYLAWARDRYDLSFLSAFLPAMAAQPRATTSSSPPRPRPTTPSFCAVASCPERPSPDLPGDARLGGDPGSRSSRSTGPLRQWAEDKLRASVAALEA